LENSSGKSDGVQVDLELLGHLQTSLQSLADDITSNLRPYVYDVNRHLGSAGKNSAFGGSEIDEAQELAKRSLGTFNVIDTTLKTMADQLEKSGEGLRKIADNYRSTEESNSSAAANY
jgi:hypothetical protein